MATKRGQTQRASSAQAIRAAGYTATPGRVAATARELRRVGGAETVAQVVRRLARTNFG
jgi:hypothetical protein